MSDRNMDHIWLSDVGGPRTRGERSLYLGRRKAEAKMMVRIFSEGSGIAPAHTDIYMTEQQARDLAVWLVANLLGERT